MKFADRAQSVKNKVKINEFDSEDNEAVKRLKDEVANLRQILNYRKKQGNLTEIEVEFHRLKVRK